MGWSLWADVRCSMHPRARIIRGRFKYHVATAFQPHSCDTWKYVIKYKGQESTVAPTGPM